MKGRERKREMKRKSDGFYRRGGLTTFQKPSTRSRCPNEGREYNLVRSKVNRPESIWINLDLPLSAHLRRYIKKGRKRADRSCLFIMSFVLFQIICYAPKCWHGGLEGRDIGVLERNRLPSPVYCIWEVELIDSDIGIYLKNYDWSRQLTVDSTIDILAVSEKMN